MPTDASALIPGVDVGRGLFVESFTSGRRLVESVLSRVSCRECPVEGVLSCSSRRTRIVGYIMVANRDSDCCRYFD